MASGRALPPPFSHTFHVDVPSGTSVDSLIDAIALVVCLPEVDQIQHHSDLRFKVVIRSRAAVSRILEAGVLRIGDQEVPIVPEGPQVILASCLCLPREVRNETLATTLEPYGKVIKVSIATNAKHPTIRTETRLVNIEMKESNSIPNFKMIAGHRVTMNYRVLNKVCRRCRREGHFKAQCREPF